VWLLDPVPLALPLFIDSYATKDYGNNINTQSGGTDKQSLAECLP
jgi:hypothetical protein